MRLTCRETILAAEHTAFPQGSSVVKREAKERKGKGIETDTKKRIQGGGGEGSKVRSSRRKTDSPHSAELGEEKGKEWKPTPEANGKKKQVHTVKPVDKKERKQEPLNLGKQFCSTRGRIIRKKKKLQTIPER